MQHSSNIVVLFGRNLSMAVSDWSDWQTTEPCGQLLSLQLGLWLLDKGQSWPSANTKTERQKTALIPFHSLLETGNLANVGMLTRRLPVTSKAVLE